MPLSGHRLSLAVRFYGTVGSTQGGNLLLRKFKAVIILLVLACGGCATSKTVNIAENGAISDNYWNSKTNCNSLPRVYSGLAHNACFTLFASRANGSLYNSFEIGGYVLNSMACAVADTLVLPYTIYKQFQWGSIQVAAGHGK